MTGRVVTGSIAFSRRAAALALGACLLIASACVSAGSEAAPDLKPAQVRISGYGFFGNLRMKRSLRLLQEGTNQPAFFRANYVEDAALLLMSQLRDDGYLDPVIRARMILEDGSELTYEWDEVMEEPLPRPLRVRRLHFHVEEGVLYHFDPLEFSGLTSIREREARGYFIESGGLVQLKRNRIYSPDRLQRGLTSLRDALERLGYQEAQVAVSRFESNPRDGRVGVRVTVDEGPRHVVRTVHEEIQFDGETGASMRRTNVVGEAYSRMWEQDYAQGIRTNYYRRGYPDTAVVFETMRRQSDEGEVLLDLRASTRPGPRVRVGDVSFVGNERTKTDVLESRVPLKEGDWLDRVRAERGRYRLSRLGVFDAVVLGYEPVDEQTRNVVYRVEEGKRIDVSLLFGYGSYELLRGGVQVEQYNVLGRAHHQRLKVTQSFKSSTANYTYTMPELLGENLDVFINGFGLRREEVSFTRQEFGGGAGIHKYFHRADTDVSFRYSYGILEATAASVNFADEGARRPTVGEFITDIRHDRRDNPLLPRQGYQVVSNIELASDYFGGDANFQRIELSGSYHRPLSDNQWLHFGMSHGVVASTGSASDDLPFARRFFPGGENSIRGYTEGRASPRNEEGQFIGAECYLSANAEFEQGLTPRWSLVVFTDAVTFAERLSEYPGDEVLVSVGGGLRWRTFIGPVRFEYGHNINRRAGDPSGTFHFSLGFPF